MPPPRHVSLDRALSKLGVLSRARARSCILEGRVTVNGITVRDPGHPVVPERARIVVDGAAVRRTEWRTIVLNKPRGTVTTRRDPEGRPTVFDLLGGDGARLVAVGRLDLATTGLLILTTDTQLADRLADPKSAIVRRYAVTVRGWLTEEDAQRMTGGSEGLRARSVRIRKRSMRETHLIVELTEGKNREIRRLCQAVGHDVTALKRIAFGGLELGTLAAGHWRDITRKDVVAAFGPIAPSRG